ncbi:MAG: inorganic phosphate transporter [Gammaproteobacteria bacterium]|nr:inorganic phosphate transporter [Gammaproteobacteria bacterium]
MEWILLLAVFFLAFSNGANDNFKGFATVWGSNVLNYRQALTLATLATVAGCIAALFLANELVQHFSGKGLVEEAVLGSPLFLLSVACSAALTIFLATRLSFPVSTTHALIGGLIGAGLAQSDSGVHFDKLIQTFFAPLFISPLLAAVLGALVYSLFRMRSPTVDCVCVSQSESLVAKDANAIAMQSSSSPVLVIGESKDCDSMPVIVGFSISPRLDKLHIFSAMAICFARGLNDTPKIAAILITSSMINTRLSLSLITLAVALGGLGFSKRVAERMSYRVTRMDHGQGLAANFITALVVLYASTLGVPVSTTHVSIGSIAGVGMRASTLGWASLSQIILAWLATLPVAAAFAWIISKLA